MTESELEVYVRSGGRRIALYAELGSYFFPDGSLNEAAFRKFVSEALESRQASPDPDARSAGSWLSAYLENVMAYLDDKRLWAPMLRLSEIAFEESARLRVEEVSLNPQRVQRLLSLAAQRPETAATRKHAPDDKRKRIFESAVAVFTERGFHQVTMDEVAAASGVAKGTVYRYFKSKEDLMDQLLIATSQRVVERFSKSFADESNVLDQIERFVHEWLIFIEENHVLYRLIQAEGIIPHSGRRTMFYEYLMSNFPMAKERIVSLNADDELKTVSFSTVAYGLLGFIDGVVNKWFRSEMSYPLRDEAATILEVLFNGFVKEGRARKAFFVAPEEREYLGN